MHASDEPFLAIPPIRWGCCTGHALRCALRRCHFDASMAIRRSFLTTVSGGRMSQPQLRGPELASRYAIEGFIGVSSNYRLSRVAPFPAAVHDCKAIIRWLRENAQKYHIDPGHIGVWGASAVG